MEFCRVGTLNNKAKLRPIRTLSLRTDPSSLALITMPHCYSSSRHIRKQANTYLPHPTRNLISLQRIQDIPSKSLPVPLPVSTQSFSTCSQSLVSLTKSTTHDSTKSHKPHHRPFSSSANLCLVFTPSTHPTTLTAHLIETPDQDNQ